MQDNILGEYKEAYDSWELECEGSRGPVATVTSVSGECLYQAPESWHAEEGGPEPEPEEERRINQSPLSVTISAGPGPAQTTTTHRSLTTSRHISSERLPTEKCGSYLGYYGFGEMYLK